MTRTSIRLGLVTLLAAPLALLAPAVPAQAHTNQSVGKVGSIDGNCIRGTGRLTHSSSTDMKIGFDTLTMQNLSAYLPCALPEPGWASGQIRVKGTLATYDPVGGTWVYCYGFGGWKYNSGSGEGTYSVGRSYTYTNGGPCGREKWYRLRTYHQAWNGAQWIGGKIDRVHWYGAGQ